VGDPVPGAVSVSEIEVIMMSAIRSIILAVGLAVAGLPGGVALAQSNSGAKNPVAGQSPDATLEIEQYQVALFYSGNLGGGTLSYKGKKHDFVVGGLGIGGFGASKISATGKVYGLKSINDFPGAYGQARYGFVVNEDSAGEMWLESATGVHIHLITNRIGLALSLGADAVYIEWQ
jgi:hypothetical protein